MEEERSTEIDLGLRDLLDILRRCWILMLVVAVVVGAGLYIFMNANHKPAYTSEASIYVMRSGDGEGGTNTSTSDISVANSLAQDGLALVKNRSVWENVKYQTGEYQKYSDFSGSVSVSNKSGTRIVKVSVTSDTAEKAAYLATEVSKIACDYINTEVYEGQNLFKVIENGAVPEHISNPVSKLTILLIAVAVALVIYVIYLVLFLMDDKINNAEDVEKYLGLNVLGQIPNRHSGRNRAKYYGAGQYQSQGGSAK